MKTRSSINTKFNQHEVQSTRSSINTKFNQHEVQSTRSSITNQTMHNNKLHVFCSVKL
ncbi:MAG: hypothetical protein ACK4ON_03625 [Bacteroidia bacterium]